MRLQDKKWHELVVGYLLCQFFSEGEKPLMFVGFPLIHGWQSLCPTGALKVATVIETHQKLLEDRDVDIYVGFERIWQKCQITRLVNHPRSQSKVSLAELIAKKCSRSQPDPKCMLVVSIESQPHITEGELKSLYVNAKVPFGRIVLISKASRERGHFSFCQLYPKPIIGKEIRVPLLV